MNLETVKYEEKDLVSPLVQIYLQEIINGQIQK